MRIVDAVGIPISGHGVSLRGVLLMKLECRSQQERKPHGLPGRNKRETRDISRLTREGGCVLPSGYARLFAPVLLEGASRRAC